LSTALYQNFKVVITTFFYLSRDAIHVHLGFAMMVLTLVITKRKMNDPKILIPGFILSVVMEILDMSNDLSRSKVYPLEYLHDLVNTNFIPICLVVLCYVGLIKTNRDSNSPSEKP
jgi:hypothetical protein